VASGVSRIIIFGKEVLELADFALPICGIDMNRGRWALVWPLVFGKFEPAYAGCYEGI